MLVKYNALTPALKDELYVLRGRELKKKQSQADREPLCAMSGTQPVWLYLLLRCDKPKTRDNNNKKKKKKKRKKKKKKDVVLKTHFRQGDNHRLFTGRLQNCQLLPLVGELLSPAVSLLLPACQACNLCSFSPPSRGSRLGLAVMR